MLRINCRAIGLRACKPGIEPARPRRQGAWRKAVSRWARRGEWRKRVEQLRAVTGVGNPKDVAAALKIEAEALTPDLLRGLQFRLTLRMAEQINQLPLTTPDDFGKMVDVLDKMDAIIHRHRGAAIGANGEASSPISLEAFRAYQHDQKGSDPTSA